jgi:hypothetical protein
MGRIEDAERERIVVRLQAREIRKRNELDAYCSTHGLYWLRNGTKTYDEQAAKKQGLDPKVKPQAYKPFPDWKYFDYAWWVLTHPDPLISEVVMFPKSREMMTSWLVAGYITHFCQYNERALALVQTQSEKKVEKLLTYSKCLYDQQPDYIRAMHPLKGGAIISSDNRQKTTSHEYENGSQIIGLPAGARQIPLYHPSIVVFDEIAHLDEAEAGYNFAKPASRQVIGISSAGPGFLANMCDDEAMDAQATGELGKVIAGVDFDSIEL